MLRGEKSGCAARLGEIRLVCNRTEKSAGF
jgi:hypothetical protein